MINAEIENANRLKEVSLRKVAYFYRQLRNKALKGGDIPSLRFCPTEHPMIFRSNPEDEWDSMGIDPLAHPNDMTTLLSDIIRPDRERDCVVVHLPWQAYDDLASLVAKDYLRAGVNFFTTAWLVSEEATHVVWSAMLDPKSVNGLIA